MELDDWKTLLVLMGHIERAIQAWSYPGTANNMAKAKEVIEARMAALQSTDQNGGER